MAERAAVPGVGLNQQRIGLVQIGEIVPIVVGRQIETQPGQIQHVVGRGRRGGQAFAAAT